MRLLCVAKDQSYFWAFTSKGSIDLPRTIEKGNTVSMVHLRTSLVAGTIRPDLLAAAIADAARGKIRSVYSVEMKTKIGLEVVVAAAAAVGNLSNFDSLEFHEKRKILLLTP